MELTLEGKKQIIHKHTQWHTQINEHIQIHKLHTLP